VVRLLESGSANNSGSPLFRNVDLNTNYSSYLLYHCPSHFAHCILCTWHVLWCAEGSARPQQLAPKWKQLHSGARRSTRTPRVHREGRQRKDVEAIRKTSFQTRVATASNQRGVSEPAGLLPPVVTCQPVCASTNMLVNPQKPGNVALLRIMISASAFRVALLLAVSLTVFPLPPPFLHVLSPFSFPS
jgi:hypothetical protein